ncbi:cathepsin B [Acrasis kona]|uniref:Cathepsin B n=1 Tax=Acrasis kona TaxID=1008807 RepID=A0AAW2Z2C3_9EUKA
MIQTTQQSIKRNLLSDANPPKSFDSRTKWPECISPIIDQGVCGGCCFGRAVSGVGVMQDRMCIASDSFIVKMPLSIQSMIGCADNGGCDGGYQETFWQYTQKEGIYVDSCSSYRAGESGDAGSCPSKCDDGSPVAKADRYWSDTYRMCSDQDNFKDIKNEIANNGPVHGYMDVYEDFYYYKTGVYRHRTGSLIGGHAIRIVGYGVDKQAVKTNVANSWGPYWGEKGFARIKEGECSVGQFVYAGTVYM